MDFHETFLFQEFSKKLADTSLNFENGLIRNGLLRDEMKSKTYTKINDSIV
jgi:hypothetical protein